MYLGIGFFGFILFVLYLLRRLEYLFPLLGEESFQLLSLQIGFLFLSLSSPFRITIV